MSGYLGPCYAHFLPLDIDSHNLDEALQTARDLCYFIFDYWGAPEESIVPYFSGRKGFHVAIATGLFGSPQPSTGLPDVFQQIREHLVKQARLRHPAAADLGIGDRLRLLRLPNARHSKSGLYKIPLTLSELFSCNAAEITDIAHRPRQPYSTDDTGLLSLYDVQPLPDAVDIYEHSLESAEQKRTDNSGLPDPATFLSRGEVDSFLCEAERKLYEQGVPEGARSWTALRFASRMRSAGYTQPEASQMVVAWNQRNHSPMKPTEARRIVGVAYRVQTPYQFGCGTGTVEEPLHTHLVNEKCPYVDRTKCKMYALFRKQTDSLP